MNTPVEFSVIISSPSDVQKERNIVRQIVAEVNEIWKNSGYRLINKTWESDVLPRIVDHAPQIEIDQAFDYSMADLMIAIFYKKIGTPTLNDISGTVHEISRAMESYKDNGNPEIIMYFKKNTRPLCEVTPQEFDEHQQMAGLQREYKEKGIVRFFNTTAQFYKHCYKDILQFMIDKLIKTGKIYSGYKRESENLPTLGVKPSQAIHSARPKNIFRLSDIVVDYIPVIFSWEKDEEEYSCGNIKTVEAENTFVIPEDIKTFVESDPKRMQNINEFKRNFGPHISIDSFSKTVSEGQPTLEFTVSKTSYKDFLITNWFLDEKIPGSNITFRDKYLSKDFDYSNNMLSRICGVGVFIISSDDKIIITKSSPDVTVSPSKYKFSASGTMHWNITFDPFTEVSRECREEINYNIQLENLKMFSYGIDYKLAYHQFCFYEWSSLSAKTIEKDSKEGRDFNKEVAHIASLPFTVKDIVQHIKSHEWDAPSAASLLTLAAKKFGRAAVEKELNPELYLFKQRQIMIDEWNKRAEREGRLAVYSVRYPSDKLEQISNDYLDKAFSFIDIEDYEGKAVLEVGCGIGLFTKPLASKAKLMACIDISEKMLERNKSYVGEELINKITYHNCFFQDYNVEHEFDVLICSLVLMHNADNVLFLQFIDKMKESARIIYIFEHTNKNVADSDYTKYRSRQEYLDCFPEYKETKHSEYCLCEDVISFIKLERL